MKHQKRVWYLTPYEGPNAHTDRNHLYAKSLAEFYDVTLLCNSVSHNSFSSLRRNFPYSLSFVEIPCLQYKGNGIARGVGMLTYSWFVLCHYLLARKKPDVLIVDSVHPVSGAVAALIKSLNPRILFIFQIRDIWPLGLALDGAISRNSILYVFFSACEWAALRRCSFIISSLRGYRNYLNRYMARFSSKDVYYFPNPISFDESIGTSNDRQTKGVKLTLVYAGGFSNAHGMKSFCESLAVINEANPDLSVDIHFYGEGVEKNDCIKLLSGYSNCKFFSSVPKDQVLNLIERYDVCIAAVRDSEIYEFGFNLNKLYDYMKAKKPILLISREYVNPVEVGCCGWRVDPGNPSKLETKLMELVELEKAELTRLGESGHQYAKVNYNINILGRHLIQTIDKKFSSKSA